MFGFRNGRGTVVVDGQVVGETLQCVHCGYVWEVKIGSGISRGWCTDCGGPTCGKEQCKNCTPFEARLDLTDSIAQHDMQTAEKILKQYPGIRII